MNVIVGAGVAALRAAEGMREGGYDGPIIMISGEQELPYEKPPLSKSFLLGTEGPESVRLKPAADYDDLGVKLELGTRVVGLEIPERRLLFEDGRKRTFDQLLVATGAAPRWPQIAGVALDGVVALRTLQDAVSLRERLERSHRLLVVGAGLVGLEVAATARRLGKEVVVVEKAPGPLARLLGPHAAAAKPLVAIHREHGAEIRTGTSVVAFLGQSRVEGAVLDTGTVVACDLVLLALGVEPAVDWLRGSGIVLADGIPVDGRGETEIPGIFAAGDVARTFHHRFGRSLRLESYGNAWAQGYEAGRAMAGLQPAGESALPVASTEQYGHRMQVVGLPDAGDRVVVRGAMEEASFVTFFLAGDRLVGAFGMNRPRDMLQARKAIAAQTPVDPRRLAQDGEPLAAA
ncbi:NAD(P)/FAD-dependent oxidoreductase [Vulgatibacter sp.]|uniref:NAD(P)/FAD-dependent oxidoreductase n=1 Tax=Vulgatibacter sp. TaxID=1971226 RepID=UPI0035653F00